MCLAIGNAQQILLNERVNQAKSGWASLFPQSIAPACRAGIVILTNH